MKRLVTDILKINDQTYVVLPKRQFHELVAKAHGVVLPGLPRKEKGEPSEASAYWRTARARNLIVRRLLAGWSRAELAKQTGLMIRTVERLEGGRDPMGRDAIETVDDVLYLAARV